MKVLFRLCIIAACLYTAIAAALYIFQERLIFLGEPLDKNFKFSFENSEFIGLVNASENGEHLDVPTSATQNSAYTKNSADESASATSAIKENGAAGEIKSEGAQTSAERVGENAAGNGAAGNNANVAAIKFLEINIPQLRRRERLGHIRRGFCGFGIRFLYFRLPGLRQIGRQNFIATAAFSERRCDEPLRFRAAFAKEARDDRLLDRKRHRGTAGRKVGCGTVDFTRAIF